LEDIEMRKSRRRLEEDKRLKEDITQHTTHTQKKRQKHKRKPDNVTHKHNHTNA
jgi:hypothetical protein